MRIVILTQYYLPETGAPQARLSDIAMRLKEMGVEVIVQTAMPNYPKMKVFDNYKRKWYTEEFIEGIKIHRSWIFVRENKTIFFRIISYFSFVFSSFITGWKRIPKVDFLICESPPLFLGISAYLLSRIKGAKLVFNVSDLWPESAQKLGLVNNNFFLKLSTILEEFLYRKSALITCQTQGIVNNISNRFNEKRILWIPNGISPELIYEQPLINKWRINNGFQEDDFLVLYAGIIGYAQGLDVILEAAKLISNKDQKIKFCIIGDGPEKERLLDKKVNEDIRNISFFNHMPKLEILEALQSANACVIPLKKIDLFKGAIPSKIFEACAYRKPILLGVEGEAKELFIDEANAGLSFDPENYVMLLECIYKLRNSPELSYQMGVNGKEYVLKKFNRLEIANIFYIELVNLLKK